MTHMEVEEKILGLYDGPISERERMWVQSHLSFCSLCRTAVEDYKKMAALLFKAPTFSEAEEDIFAAKVMSKINSAEPALSPWGVLFRWGIPLLGSGAMAVWVFFFVLPDTPSLSAVMSDSVPFSSDVNEMMDLSPVQTPKLSHEDVVVSWMKE